MKSFLLLIALFSLSYALKSRPRRSQRKSFKAAGNQLFGVSLSSITGFEKPMIPPKIINFDMPINYNQPPTDYNVLALDLPSKTDIFPNNSTFTSFPTFNPTL